MPAGILLTPFNFTLPPFNAVQPYGVRNATDVTSFLANEWLDKRGMNNCLLYGLGVWQSNSGGSDAPYSGNVTLGATDSISGAAEAAISTSEWTANGALATTTNLSPTLGRIWIVNSIGSGLDAGADSILNFKTTPADTNAVKSTWKSTIGVGAMWIGDTPAKRCVWSGAGVGSTSYGNTFSGKTLLPPPTGNPMIPGSNTTYLETTSNNQNNGVGA
jgi:hypothetical protein